MISGDIEEYIVDPLLFWVQANWGNNFFADSAAIRGYTQWTEHRLGARIVKAALQVAEEKGFVTGVHDKYADSYYSLTDSGVVYLDNKMSRPQTVLGKLSIFGESWVRSALARIADEKDEDDILGDVDISIPASDRTVTLNHNQPDYQDAVAALDKVVEAFRDDHRLDNELGHEKGALLKALEAGRELLNDTVVNVRIGTALLIEPLQRLVVKYEKELVAALASAAIPLILKVFGVS